MKKWLSLACFVFALSWTVASFAAGRYVGRVSDEQGNPLPYVSVYVKDNPYVGTVTGNGGEFALDIPPADRADNLVFSFIGFRTVELPVSTLTEETPVEVTLVEQPVLLDGAEVSAKISKKESRKIKKAVLARFVERLKQDFPDRMSEYRVVSTYQGAQDDRQLLRHEMIGTLEEYPQSERRKSDSIVVFPESVKEFTTQEVEAGYEKLNELAAEQFEKNAKKNRRKKGNVPATLFEKRELDEQMLKMHRYLWGGYTGSIVGLLNVNKLSMWDYTTVGDQNILTYTDKRNFIGIAKMKLQMFFYVDPATLSIGKIAQSLEAELHIPFGYKLSDEELELVNIIQMQTDTLEKYRVRHAYLDVKRNVFFREVDGNRVVKEKNLDMKTRVADRKDRQLNYSAQAKLLVTGKPVIVKEPR